MNLLGKYVDKDFDSLRYTYTEADALVASEFKPLHIRKRGPMVERVQKAAHKVAYETPQIEDWRELADAVNLAETLLDMRVFDDPDGLFTDMVAAICQLSRNHGEGKPMRLNAVQLSHLLEFADCFAQMLQQTPARTYIRAHLATEKRLRKLLAEGISDTEVHAI